MKQLRAWACVGSHGRIFVTEMSLHESTIGRLQIYASKKDALRNDSRVVEVVIDAMENTTTPMPAKEPTGSIKLRDLKHILQALNVAGWKGVHAAKIPVKCPAGRRRRVLELLEENGFVVSHERSGLTYYCAIQ